MTKNFEELVINCAKDMVIKISEEETKAFAKKFEKLDNEFSILEENFPNLKNIEPLTHIIDIPDRIMRSDIPVESPNIEELLKNSAHVNGREIEVPKVVG